MRALTSLIRAWYLLFAFFLGRSRGDLRLPGALSKIHIILHGNWCGPYHGGNAPPIDAIDNACMLHDKCYSEHGYWSCYCDQILYLRLREQAESLWNRTHGTEGSRDQESFQALRWTLKKVRIMEGLLSIKLALCDVPSRVEKLE